jgi:hypothetical protein
MLDIKSTNWLKAGVNFNVSSGVRYLGDEGVFRSAYNAVSNFTNYR